MNNDAIYDLLRDSFKEMATEARPADLMPATVRHLRRRTLSLSIGAVGLVAALLVGIPVTVAAADHTRGPGSQPGLTVTQSASVPIRRSAEPARPETARSTATHADPSLTEPSVTGPSLTGPSLTGPSLTGPAGWSPAARRS